MSKGTGVGVGESSWKDRLRRRNLAAAAGRVTAAGLAGLIVAGGLTGGPAGMPAVVVEAAQAPVAEGGFTAEQAAAGWSVYARQCGECHGIGLDGAEAPALRGVDFLNVWAGQTSDELFEYVRDGMPPGLGGSLGDQVYLNSWPTFWTRTAPARATRR